ncbi:nucleotidyl transferase AbiEii/AbiGii toxin family protein [Massilia sp. UMI-21]|nr:nucleotidyl transferase AbiEii/AbiGii toxin family protein [Massilia sp. UMI-21]
MLKVRPDKPLSDTLLALIRTLDAVMKQLVIPYFVIGASARDILVEHVYGLDTGRATRDIDFAVAISSWADYDRLKAALAVTGEFTLSANAHRLMFGTDEGAYPLDLVPFDGVEKEGEIAWPPSGESVMNVAGYGDAYASALDIGIAPDLQVKIVSLPAMVVLKILAWNDRPERDKHASDVLLVLRSYHQAGQFDRLYDEALDLLEQYDYELELAGAALLGSDAQRDIAVDVLAQVRQVFASERILDKFTVQMMKGYPGTVARARRLMQAFLDNIG